MTQPADFLYNNQLNAVWPPLPAPPLPHKDARAYALERLREYICALVFYRTGAVDPTPGPPIPFQLPVASVHLAQPDDITNLDMPAIGVIPGRGVHETYGLGPPDIIEGSDGLAGPGTVLLRQSEYIETFILEVWGSKNAERRALMAGLKAAFRNSDGSYAIRMQLPAYYDIIATYSLNESQYIDGDEPVRNRRRGHLMIEMRVDEVMPTNVRPLTAIVETTVLDASASVALDCQTT